MKVKIKWSKLYSFSCFQPRTSDQASDEQELIGQPGFSRVVFCNEPQIHRTRPWKYSKNSISTTKYNIVTFLPIALFEQFRRVANLYFLLAAALSLTSYGAVFKPVSLIAPLVLVVGVSMLKEAFEDWYRFLQDLNVNARKVKVHVGNGLFLDKSWRELSVGDIVKVAKNDYFPGDLLFISSSYEDGLCYVETMNLDGETNLKIKRCLEDTLRLNEDGHFRNFNATIRCEDPNPNLYSFVGNFEFENRTHPLGPCQVLLRDSKLRNTDHVYGVVIFAGKDTKVVQNSTGSPSKRSRVEKKMDRVIYLLFSILVLISLITSIGSVVILKSGMADWWYLRLKYHYDGPSFNLSKPLLSGVTQFIRAVILYGYLIPISLYVSIEIVKVLQAMFISKDLQMYDEVTRKSVQARTSNLNEELGQVQTILTDKTGTLTCNQMEFTKCSIAGISYGGNINEVDLAASKRIIYDARMDETDMEDSDMTSHSFRMVDLSMSASDISIQRAALEGQEDANYLKKEYFNYNVSDTRKKSAIKGFNFSDERLFNNRWIHRSDLFEVAMFFRVMALCHTGIPIQDVQSDKFKYEAESPEEVSFLIASQEFGFQFSRRTQSVMVLQEFDPSYEKIVKREYKLLNLLEFSSSRKRMSVIVSDEDGRIYLLCKGADSIIFDKLAVNGRTYQEATNTHLSNYAEDGFRTLTFAYRMLDQSEYLHWNSMFSKAKATIGPERDELLETASDLIEKDLILLGVAAVEDKLQEGVPECIDKLAQAGLKIWLLTGDKKETAINVGFACSLLRQDMTQLHLCLSKEAESKNLQQGMKKEILSLIKSSYRTICEEQGSKPSALVVDGKALEIALKDDMKDHFLQLAVNCSSVICCRLSPKQKALVTRLVKKYTGKSTLAIGDGANDVGMIQEADIGVGISGMEGMQAVMASDFSLPQFRFLERLLIVHGHWCYKRISKMVLYFVYKNIVFGLTLFYYELYTNFSGEVLYDDWYMVMFNVLLTSLPVIGLGVFEQDVPSDVCLQFPALYKQGQRNLYFSWTRIVGWMLNAMIASAVIFTSIISVLSPSAFRQDGKTADITQFGAMMYTCVIWTVNCQMALILNHFTWIQHLFIWGSIILWYIFLLTYGSFPPAYSNKAFHVLLESIGPVPTYWLVTLLVVVTSLLPYSIHTAAQRMFRPSDDHVIQEMKHCKRDETEKKMWEREQFNSQRMTQVGFSARVDARIVSFRQMLHRQET